MSEIEKSSTVIHSGLIVWGNYPERKSQLSGSGRAHWGVLSAAGSSRAGGPRRGHRRGQTQILGIRNRLHQADSCLAVCSPQCHRIAAQWWADLIIPAARRAWWPRRTSARKGGAGSPQKGSPHLGVQLNWYETSTNPSQTAGYVLLIWLNSHLKRLQTRAEGCGACRQLHPAALQGHGIPQRQRRLLGCSLPHTCFFVHPSTRRPKRIPLCQKSNPPLSGILSPLRGYHGHDMRLGELKVLRVAPETRPTTAAPHSGGGGGRAAPVRHVVAAAGGAARGLQVRGDCGPCTQPKRNETKRVLVSAARARKKTRRRVHAIAALRAFFLKRVACQPRTAASKRGA